MPTDFQKVMDLTLEDMDCILVFLDDISTVAAKRTKKEHTQKVRHNMEFLDKAN